MKTHRRRRSAPLIWISGGLAAALLVLGINGTLSSWTQAIITNNHNDVASTKAVALSESSGGALCTDTATSADNTATCSTVNKYGGTSGGGTDTAPLDPDSSPTGDSRTTTVTLANTGTGDGHLSLDAAACGHTMNQSTTVDTTGSYDVCTQILVSLECPDVSFGPSSPVTLTAFAGDHVIGDLAAGDSTDCTFTVALPAATPSGYADQLASQVLTWTLAA